MQRIHDALISWLAIVQEHMSDQAIIKISLGGHKGEEANLKQVHIKPVLIRQDLKYSFVFRYQTKDITKNFSEIDTLAYLEEKLHNNHFQIATLITSTEHIIAQQHKGIWKIRKETKDTFKPIDLLHDKQKQRKIGSHQKNYLHALGLADEQGNVYKNGQDKFKQINHYIELLSTHVAQLPKDKTLQIVDMGAGKGYLTFALYDYINNELKQQACMEGIEYRKDLVDLCNQIAVDSHFDKLTFREGSIEDYQPSVDQLDVLIALHACDTATDDAIAKGILYQSELIVVAPCCHKQIRRELEKSKVQNPLTFMTRHGIFMERHAEMLTDSIRALLLEYCGYQVKVQQFISDLHTPKNVMIVATKAITQPNRQAEILHKLDDLKTFYGIESHYLERILKLDSK